jgi:hypothetical protein
MSAANSRLNRVGAVSRSVAARQSCSMQFDLSHQLKIPIHGVKCIKFVAADFSSEAKMFKIRNIAIALACVASVIGMSEFSSAELLKGQERETFIASARKSCIGTHGQGQTANLTKAVFEQYCACTANGLADRLSKDQLAEEADRADLSKENEAIVKEEATRCLAKNGGRDIFVSSATKSCIKEHTGEKGAMAKPAFEQYCACMANGIADRIPVTELIGDGNVSKEHPEIVDEEYGRCFAKNGGRELFAANATKACVATYDQGNKKRVMTKPRFEKYCACVAKGMADRLPAADLLKDYDTSEMPKDNQTIVDEEASRCLAAANEPEQRKGPDRK